MATETHEIEIDAPVLYALAVRTPIAPMHAEPRIASQMVSQQVAGHRVEITDEDGDWVRARGEDEYEGWMHIGFLSPDTRKRRGSPAAVRISLGCVTATESGHRRSLPLRAILASDEAPVAGNVVDAAERARQFPLDPVAITQTAQAYFSATSYLWGGVTPWGADCSGLVQSSFALHGLQLPRDAWQQAEAGTDAGSDVGDLRPADLLFFSDRDDQRITHVGIALGERRMVHLALGRGGYAIESLDDRSDDYIERLRSRFVRARRLV